MGDAEKLRMRKEAEEAKDHNEQERLEEGTRKKKEICLAQEKAEATAEDQGKERDAIRFKKMVQCEKHRKELLERRSKREKNAKEKKRTKDVRREARRLRSISQSQECRTLHKPPKQQKTQENRHILVAVGGGASFASCSWHR